jgi:diacylglycerol kinase family enzyme
MMDNRVDVIATTISGSIQDWGKVKRIVPLFDEHGMKSVRLRVANSHREAREQACDALKSGGRILISAGGSGTFNAVLEGCYDSGVPRNEILLGFLRKGSADLIGKTLGMPDEIESAIAVFAESIAHRRTVPCDVILAVSQGGGPTPRHFVGYGGAELFGRIPQISETRIMKYYKGVLGQLFGDLGPFTTGMTLAVLEKVVASPWRKKRKWKIVVDGDLRAEGRYHALILVNGYLGPDLPYSSDPLGSGKFYLFALADLGIRRLPLQFKAARTGTILQAPGKLGMEPFTIEQSLRLEPEPGDEFAVNVDGSEMLCRQAAQFRIVDTIRLISRD